MPTTRTISMDASSVNTETTPLMNTSSRRSLDTSLLHLESGVDFSQHDSDGSDDMSNSKGDNRPAGVSLPTIGILGSLSILVNSITGPAMVNLPLTFQRSGVIPTIVTLVFISILSSFCSLHMANTISKVPGNGRFRKEIEFSQAFWLFFGPRWHAFTQAVYFLCVTCLNVSSIVDTAQVVDTFVGHWIPSGAVALELSSASKFVWWDPSICNHQELVSGECIPFEHSGGLLLTVGYLITIALFLPLALMDLKENVAWQILAFFILLITSIQFTFEFLYKGLDVHNLTLWGDDWDALLGVVMFNFPLCVAVPAWLSEKKPSVNVSTIVWTSTWLSTFLYVLCGTLGAMAISNVSGNMLESMMSGAFGTSMQIGAFIFEFFIIGIGIPLFSVFTRMNLTGSGLCSHAVGNLLGVFFPFSISWLFYQGDAVTELLAWGGVLFTSAVAFILPLLLALHTVLEFDVEGVIQVYGGKFTSWESQRNALIVLLGLAVVSVIVAIIGLIFAGSADV